MGSAQRQLRTPDTVTVALKLGNWRGRRGARSPEEAILKGGAAHGSLDHIPNIGSCTINGEAEETAHHLEGALLGPGLARGKEASKKGREPHHDSHARTQRKKLAR